MLSKLTIEEIEKFQRKVLREMDSCDGRILLGLDTGLGKTRLSLQWMHNHNAWPALVVCPAIVKNGWEMTALTEFGIRSDVFEGRKAPRFKGINHSRLMIINYDIISGWIDYLSQLKIKTLVLDEPQFVKDRTKIRTKACIELAQSKKNIIGCSATPLLNRPAELWPLLHMLWPRHYSNFWEFAQEYCAPRKTPWGWTFKGATNLPKLHKELKARGMIRYLKADVITLPKKTRKVVLLKIRRPDEYQEAETDFISWMRKNNRSRLSRVMKAKQINQITHLRILAAQLKTKPVIKWLGNWLDKHPGEKILVFAIHRGFVRALRRRFEHTAVVIDGSTSSEKRKIAVRQFRQNPSTRMMIGNIQAAGTGLDGLQVASAVAFVEFPWRPGDVIQGEDRAYRIGTTQKVRVYFLVAEDTIEDRLCKLIQKKQNDVSAVLDGSTQTNSLNLFDDLVQEMMSNGTRSASQRTPYSVQARRRAPKRSPQLGRR